MVAHVVDLDENVAMADARIDFVSWGFDAHDPGASFGPRVLPDYDFIWIIDGDASWEHDGVAESAPAGSLILARPGMRDAMRWDQRVLSRNFYLHFALGGRHDLPPTRDWPTVRRLPSDDIARPLLRHLAHLLERRPGGWAEAARASLLCLLRAFITGHLETAGATARLAAPIEACIAYAVGRWSNGVLTAISMPELARVSRLSREQLTRVFRAELGLPPVEAFRLARLERAALLLNRRPMPIGEVARMTGFDDAFLFARRFRAAFGCPPTAYRARIAAGQRVPRTLPNGIRTLARRLWEQSGGPR
jgi:AraC family transcriptional regulator